MPVPARQQVYLSGPRRCRCSNFQGASIKRTGVMSHDRQIVLDLTRFDVKEPLSWLCVAVWAGCPMSLSACDLPKRSCESTRLSCGNGPCALSLHWHRCARLVSQASCCKQESSGCVSEKEVQAYCTKLAKDPQAMAWSCQLPAEPPSPSRQTWRPQSPPAARCSWNSEAPKLPSRLQGPS